MNEQRTIETKISMKQSMKNGKTAKKSPADKPATGGFQDLVDGIDQLLMGETDDLLAHPEKVSSVKK